MSYMPRTELPTDDSQPQSYYPREEIAHCFANPLNPYLNPIQSNPIQPPHPPSQELCQEIVKACASVFVETVACTDPDGTLLAYHAGLPAYANSLPAAAVNTVGEDTEDAQTRFEF